MNRAFYSSLVACLALLVVSSAIAGEDGAATPCAADDVVITFEDAEVGKPIAFWTAKDVTFGPAEKLKLSKAAPRIMTGWLLAAYGYSNDFAEQSEQTLLGIRLMVSIYPAVPLLIGAGCLFFYAITKQVNIQMTEELAERRKKLPMPTAD